MRISHVCCISGSRMENQHIANKTNWGRFCRRHPQKHLLQTKFVLLRFVIHWSLLNIGQDRNSRKHKTSCTCGWIMGYLSWVCMEQSTTRYRESNNDLPNNNYALTQMNSPIDICYKISANVFHMHLIIFWFWFWFCSLFARVWLMINQHWFM